MPHAVYRFGDCRIDPSVRELRRGGDLVVLSPKVFDCLAYLIERRERAVGRDELVAAVWGRTEITDTLLGQTILKARRAVGDSAEAQNAIRTIPRFGYAWVADVDIETEDDEPAAVAAPPVVTSKSTFRWIVTLAVVLAAIGALFVFSRLAHRGESVPIADDTAAVLPVDVSAPPEWTWVRLGLMDAIASRLRDGGQAVVPSDNVVALARATANAGHPADVQGATGAKQLIAPSASWSDAGWTVRLELKGAQARSVTARDRDVLLAGRAAADRLLASLGKKPPDDAGDAQKPDLLQRVEAALLTDDLDGARRLLQAAPEALKATPEYGLKLAKIDFRAGQFDAADERLRALLATAPVESAPVLRARILNGIGHVAVRKGRADAATAAYVEAATLLENRNEPADLGQAYMGRGNAAQMRQRYDEAREDFSRAHVAFQLAGDNLALARVEANEGMLDAARERYATAAASLDSAARRFESFGTPNELAMTTSVAIGAYLALLAPHEALAASERAWPLRERIANPRVRRALAINRALALESNGRRAEASALLDEVAAAGDSTHVQAVARAELARIVLASGDAQRAADLALAALPALDDADEPRDRATAWRSAVSALRASGRANEAADQVARFDEWARSRTEPAAAIYASLARAEQQAAERRDARADYEHALARAVEADVPADIAEVAVSFGTTLIAAGDLERATAIAGQAARWADRDFGCALLAVRLYAALGQHEAWQHALAVARTLAGDRDLPPELMAFAGRSPGAAPP